VTVLAGPRCRVAKDQFIVANLSGAWCISSGQGHRGPFPSRADAIRAAVIAAQVVKQDRRLVEVLVYCGAEPYSVWSSDPDGYVSGD
jgi:hypothetical protein